MGAGEIVGIEHRRMGWRASLRYRPRRIRPHGVPKIIALRLHVDVPEMTAERDCHIASSHRPKFQSTMT
jgi:hypothetical protein